MPDHVIDQRRPIDPAELEAFLDRFLAERMAEHHVPGAAIVFVQGSRILFAKGYGYANLEDGVPVDPERTLFRWASVSKLFPISGILQLAEQGQIDLDAEVNRYLQNWQVASPFPEPVRMRYLLTHTDGFGARNLATFALDPAELRPLDIMLNRDIGAPVQEPGRWITYGSSGTALAAYLIERITGLRFEDYVQARFFDPLGMLHSSFYQDLPPELAQNVALIYRYQESAGVYTPTPFLYLSTPPTGGLTATPIDVAHFVAALLGGGRYADRQVLSVTSVESMFTRQFEPYPGLPGVTYGFMEHLYNGQRGLLRDGSGLGIRSQVYLLPEYNLGYVYVQNADGGEVIDELNEAFLEHYYPVSKAFHAIRIGADLHYSGHYCPTQTSRYDITKVEALFAGELRVMANDDQTLTIAALGMGDPWGGFEGASHWTEIGSCLFRRLDRERYVAFELDERGLATHLLSGSGYHGSYYRLKWYETSAAQFIGLGVCLAMFLTKVIIWPFGLLGGDKVTNLVAVVARWIAVGTSLCDLVGFAGLICELFVKRIAGFPAYAFGISHLAVAMLGVLLAGAILGLWLPIFTILAWRAEYWSVWGRLHYSLLAVSTWAFAWWLNSCNLLGFHF